MSEEGNKPPVFKTWSAWYWLVVIFLVLQIVLFMYFTKYFS